MTQYRILISALNAVAANRPEGYLEAVLAAATEHGPNWVVLDDHAYARLKDEFKPLREPAGPGTELKKLLGRIGIVATPGCSCNRRAADMDAKGCDWCDEHVDEITGWLREEATKRKLPFVDLVGKMLVRRAIRNARQEESRAAKESEDSEGSPELRRRAARRRR